MTHQPVIALTFEQSLHQAVAEVNRWRGHCLELHARLERAVNAALRHWQPECPLPQKFADRLKALARLAAADGPHANKSLVSTIDQLQELRSEWRDRLAHATSAVHLDQARDWIWHFSMPRSGGKIDDSGAITRCDGEELESRLSKAVNALRSQLRKADVPHCC
jgi:hypothetical protein